MDVREKLVELLDDIQVRGEDFTDYEIYGMRVPDTVSNEDVASHLIAHGVTVRERGRWLNWKGEPFQKDDFGWDWTCSVCKNTLEYEEPVTAEEFPSNFCPNCGADMREKKGKVL